MISVSQLITLNEQRWAKCIILPSRLAQVQATAKRLVAEDAKLQYLHLATFTGVPWWVVAVIHEREADQNWGCSIAQGDPWNKVSRHVPKGRGPFTSFFNAAVDALTKCPPYAAKWKDWSAGGTLTLLEMYNGLGYEDYHNEASPYIWGATNLEQHGKYESDGNFVAYAWDSQLGCAALLKAMTQLDSSIQFTSAANVSK